MLEFHSLQNLWKFLSVMVLAIRVANPLLFARFRAALT